MATHPRKILGPILAAALVMAGAACSGGSSGETGPSIAPAHGFPLTLTDDDGVRVTLHDMPRRIITFAPSRGGMSAAIPAILAARVRTISSWLAAS